jgi:mono/diheme cytochrome c family protein
MSAQFLSHLKPSKTAEMRSAAIFTLFVAAVSTAAQAQERPDAAAIRAGRSLATSVCFACHVVSPNQAVAPVMGPGIPGFQDIANRPGVTADLLTERMKSARWHDASLAPTLLPMSHLSDTERSQVAAYILSLRTRED